MVFYRKYRPQTISELDLASVREKLTAILSSKNLPHAFLFTGGKGLGKTSSARILAKAINCTAPKGIEPCNKCMACVSITDGSNIDVLEIDAASNGGVEEMRILRERVKFSPSTLKKKVYIIDEVHMLSTGAFNALLKTLEEPPGHAVFVLATTELHKLPATVVSRTFQVQFEKPTEEELVHSLNRIVKGEGIKVEKGVLSKIYEMAEGSFRDGAKLLEELVLSSDGGTLTQELLGTTFKTTGISAEVFELLTAYASRDAKKALLVIAKLSDLGADFKVVVERLVDHLRGLLMLRNGIESEEKDVAGLNISHVKDLLKLSNEAYGELKVSVIPQLPLELMSVKFCIIDVSQKKVEEKSETENVPVVENEPKKVTKENTKSATKDVLAELTARLNAINKPGAALLRSAKRAEVLDNEFVIITPFPIHAERLMSENVFKDIQKVVAGMVEGNMDVIVRVSSDKN